MMDSLKSQLCNIQGRLFELAEAQGFDSPVFVSAFMNSETAAHFDLAFDHTQWAGEAYLLEQLDDEAGGLPKGGVRFGKDVMYWAGYNYRYWHFMTGESSKEIYAQADAETMRESYLGIHTLDLGLAVGNLKEKFRSKRTE